MRYAKAFITRGIQLRCCRKTKPKPLGFRHETGKQPPLFCEKSAVTTGYNGTMELRSALTLHDDESICSLAEQLHRSAEFQFGRSAFDVNGWHKLLRRVASGGTELWPTFGVPSYCCGVAIIWPRPLDAAAPVAELKCWVYQCSSWTLVELPEVLFFAWNALGKRRATL
jgi:hypothetical protein